MITVFQPTPILMLLLGLAHAETGEMGSADPASGGAEPGSGGADPDDPFFDVYTIVAIVLLSCIGLMLLLRMLFACVTCGVALERTEEASSSRRVQIAAKACGADKEEA